MQSAEEFAWEVLASDDFVLTPHEVLTDLIRARDEAIRADERAKARAELERLRAGIKALIVEYDDPEDDDMMEPDYYWGLSIASSDLAELLNPTEGEN